VDHRVRPPPGNGRALIVVSLATILTMIGTALHASGIASQAPAEPADVA
jgi:hypothetical protein